MQKDNENTNQNNHPDRSGEVKRARSSAWVALTILSVIAVSAISANTDRDQRGFYDRWSLAWSSISLGLGFIASVLHFAHNLGTGGSSVEDKFVSTYMETALVSIEETVVPDVSHCSIWDGTKSNFYTSFLPLPSYRV